MNRLVLAPLALSDLQEIWSYIALDNPEAADGVLHSLKESMERLIAAPSLGRPRPELEEHLRSLSTGRYVLVYRHAEPEVHIVRVLHSARDIEEMWGG